MTNEAQTIERIKATASPQKLYNFTRRDGKRSTKYTRPQITVKGVAKFLQSRGWEVEVKQEWIGSDGVKSANGIYRVTEGHDKYANGLYATKKDLVIKASASDLDKMKWLCREVILKELNND